MFKQKTKRATTWAAALPRKRMNEANQNPFRETHSSLFHSRCAKIMLFWAIMVPRSCCVITCSCLHLRGNYMYLCSSLPRWEGASLQHGVGQEWPRSIGLKNWPVHSVRITKGFSHTLFFSSFGLTRSRLEIGALIEALLSHVIAVATLPCR